MRNSSPIFLHGLGEILNMRLYIHLDQVYTKLYESMETMLTRVERKLGIQLTMLEKPRSNFKQGKPET